MNRFRWILITALLLASAAFVWPTPYRYDHFKAGPIEMPVRINRFTGRGECFRGETYTEPGDLSIKEDSTNATSVYLRKYGKEVSYGWRENCR